MSKRAWVVELVMSVTRCDAPTAEMLVERLTEEGLLHLGYGDADIDRVVKTFTDTFGTTKVSKPDRWAANRLVKRYGAQSVVGIVQLLGQMSTEKYAPVVNSVADLESKWVSVLNFLRKHKGEEEINV
jgi:hypothetical protein